MKTKLLALALTSVLCLMGCEKHDHDNDQHDHSHSDSAHKASKQHANHAEHADEKHADEKHDEAHTEHAPDDHDHDKETDTDHHDEHDNHKHDEHEHDTRQTGSHVHGVAQLSLALDGKNLAIELESPLYNLVGFEHMPESTEQTKKVAQVEAILAQANNLFKFDTAAACKSTSTHNVTLFADHAEHGHDEKEHDDHDHDNHNDHADKHEHSDHSNALIEYTFTCDAPENLSLLTTELFAQLPNLEELEAVYLGPAVQTQFTLTPSNTEFKLAK